VIGSAAATHRDLHPVGVVALAAVARWTGNSRRRPARKSCGWHAGLNPARLAELLERSDLAIVVRLRALWLR
jgi:hypothetical protein